MRNQAKGVAGSQPLFESLVCPFDEAALSIPRSVFMGRTLGIKKEDTANVAGRFWFQRGVLFLWCRTPWQNEFQYRITSNPSA